ncbi:MAG: trypsin-like peptidase domain-containing protein [Phycisphaerae bacterium]
MTNRRIGHRVGLRIAVGVALIWAGPGRAQVLDRPPTVKDLRDLQEAFVRLAKRVKPTVVAVRTYATVPLGPRDPNSQVQRREVPRSHGSGAILSHDGFILTNTHVIEGAQAIGVVLHDGREFEAKLVQADQRSDLAVLKIDTAGLRSVKFGDLEDVRQGQWCFAMGNPFGLANATGQLSVTYGIVAALGQDLSNELNAGIDDDWAVRYYGNLIQTSAAINPGNSGGPLFDIDGRMIGVVTAIASSSGVTEGLGFAIPMSELNRRIIETLRKGEAFSYGYLGVQFNQSPRGTPTRRRGVRITGLAPPNGPAGRAGLRAADVIVEFSGVPVRDADHFQRLIGGTPAGTTAVVKYLRDGQERSARITLDARPVNQVAMGEDARLAEVRTIVWRGATLQEPPPSLLRAAGLTDEESGLAVVSVEPNSDADRGGLEAPQMILFFDDHRVRSVEDFIEADQRASDRVRLKVHGHSGIKTVRMPRLNRSQ